MNGSKDFSCLHCGAIVSTAREQSGVGNRNHCPYCLWSRHLDWREAGDRLSACKGAMRPVALTLKRTRNKYSTEASGELMLVHRCTECGARSINRIAADDLADTLVDVFRSSIPAGSAALAPEGESSIRILGWKDWAIVSRRLYGEVRAPDPIACTAAPVRASRADGGRIRIAI